MNIEPKWNLGHMLPTLTLLVAGLWFISGISSATEKNAKEIEHQQEISELERKYIRESLDRIEKILAQAARTPSQ